MHCLKFVLELKPEVAEVGAAVMLVTLLGLIVLIFCIVLRYDPEARGARNHGRPG